MNIRLFTRLLYGVVLVCLALPAGASFSYPGGAHQDERAGAIIQNVLGTGPSIQDFTASFSYTMSRPGNAPVTSTGRIYWSHGSYKIVLPNLEIMVDGHSQWIYNPEERVVYRSPYEQGYSPDLMQTLYLFLISRANRTYLGETYDSGAICDKIGLNYLDPFFGYEQAYVWINRESSFVQRMVLVDRFEKTTTYHFQGIRFNQGLSHDMFVFDENKYPSVEIIDGRE